MRRFAPQLFAQLFCFPLLLILIIESQAQFPMKPRLGRQVIQNPEVVYTEVKTEGEVDPRYQLRAEQALRADFRKLQVLNIGLLKQVFRSNTADKNSHKEIGSTLSEIKKVASRLRANLGVPKIEEAAPDDISLAPGVLLLDKTITSFVENPLFQERRVVDPELVVRAGKDITEIVRLSDFLRKLTKEN